MAKKTNTNATANNNTIKGGSTMKNTNVHAQGYQTKDMIRKELKTYGVELTNNQFKNTKRDELLAMLEEKKAETNTPAEETSANAIPVGDFSYDNAPAPYVYGPDTSMTILRAVILQANTNRDHNYISDWMLTSIISELVVGHPLKGKDENDKWTEFYKSFTDDDKAMIKAVRTEFLKRSGFIAHHGKDGKTTGYIIPTKSLIYGRHVWLGYACIYHFKDKNGQVVEYEVSLNGIRRKGGTDVVALSDEAYAKLDNTCTFIR